MYWCHAFSATFWRELRALCNHPKEIIFCYCVPITWILVVWSLLGGGVVTSVPVGLVDADMSASSRHLVRELQATRPIDQQTYLSVPEALDAMRQGDVYGIISIPPGYGRASKQPYGSSVVIYLDENRYAVAGSIQAAVEATFAALASQKSVDEFLSAGIGPGQANRFLLSPSSDFILMGNQQESFLAFLGSVLIPGVLAAAGMLAFLTAIFREEWDKSIKNWFVMANWNISAALCGKFACHFLLYCLLFLFFQALFAGEGGFYFKGSLILWFCCGAATLAVFVAAAILIGAIAPSWRLGFVMGAGYAAPALPFTGFSIPLDSMHPIVRSFSECLPLTWLIQGQQRLWTMGASLPDLSDVFINLFALFIIPLLIGYPLFARSFRKKAMTETG